MVGNHPLFNHRDYLIHQFQKLAQLLKGIQTDENRLESPWNPVDESSNQRRARMEFLRPTPSAALLITI